MFTGLIERTGQLAQLDSHQEGACLRISVGEGWGQDDPIALGESIAVNGVCLTVTARDESSFSADVLRETLACTSLGTQQVGATLNLERAMRADARFGGHIVSGHVDGTGSVAAIEPLGRDYLVRIACDSSMIDGMVHKGSIALDGISLTLSEVTENEFCVHIIPVTWSKTNIHSLRLEDKVNIEIDMLGKYVMKALRLRT